MSEVKHIKKVEMRLADLHVQHIPYVPYSRWWHGLDMMALKTSPHVHLMECFRDNGFKWELIKQSCYVLERKYRRQLGRSGWTDDYIRQRCKVRYKIFKSIKKEGFKHDKRKPVCVLQTPFIETRYGHKVPGVVGPEIWDGAGRCAAAYVLGYERIPVMLCEDKDPGSRYWRKIQKEWETFQLEGGSHG